MKKEEIALLLDQLQAEEQSERVWREMISTDTDGSETYRDIEHHLLTEADEEGHNLGHWKHFGK